ncbi:MAG TPA: M28 family peptidase [Vicinamibacterales bacterium]
MRVIGIVAFAILSLAIAGAQEKPAQAPPTPQLLAPPVKPLAESYLQWPLPESSREYARIDGARLHPYVEELAAISRRSRDAGNQWWGRITGTPAHTETQNLLAAKFRALGLTDVRLDEYPLPPAWFPTSWQVRVSQAGNTVTLRTAHPVLRASATPPAGLDLDAVYVGLGTPADFAGRDVRGKAVIIYSVPTPSALNHSARTDGAMKIAEDRGAAAILIVLGIPGNFATQLWGSGGEGPNQTKVPWFSLGQDDGRVAREMIERDAPVKVHLELSIEIRQNLKPAAVWGVLPGATDENILVIAHSDGFWEAAVDNASGVSSMLGLIEYFTKVPRERRRRTITFMVPVGHHVTPDVSLQKLHDTGKGFFEKTALIINAEHVTTTQTYLYGNVLRKSNTVTAHRFFVGRSRRLARLLVDDFRLFGVGLYELPSTRFAVAGDLSKLTEDAPGIEVIESNAFYHSDHDTPDIIPAAGLESITRAYAKLIDDGNRFDLKDIVDPPAAASGQPR